MILKTLKYIGIFIILIIAFLYLTKFKPKDIITSMISISMKYKGLTMQAAKWQEFDLTNIPEESRAIRLGGLDSANALSNYRIRTFYPFDGDVGFIGGSDYEKQWNIHTDAIKIDPEIYDMYWPDKHETAYLFRTDDDGKSFTKISLIKGYHVDAVLKYKKNYYAIVENYLMEYKTYVSKDKGKTWKVFFDGAIECFFSEEKFIFSRYVRSKDNTDKANNNLYHFFYTSDRGMTSRPIPKKVIQYTKYGSLFNLHKGRLLFFENEQLVWIDIDTLEEEKMSIKIPQGYGVASGKSRYYGRNPLAFGENDRNQNNFIQINKEDGRPYIYLQNINAPKDKPSQVSIWYPLEDKHIIFDKKISQIVPLKVSGNYIGGFIKKASVLVHIWTLDNGKNWKYEVLPDYYLLKGIKVAHDRIWMTALVRGERPDKKEGYPKVKGSFLVMGTLKPKKEKASEIIPEDFTVEDHKK
jgi:hypothetical protein